MLSVENNESHSNNNGWNTEPVSDLAISVGSHRLNEPMNRLVGDQDQCLATNSNQMDQTILDMDTCSAYDYHLSSPEVANTAPGNYSTPYETPTNTDLNSTSSFALLGSNSAGNSLNPLLIHHHSFPPLPDYLSYAFSMWRMQGDGGTIGNHHHQAVQFA